MLRIDGHMHWWRLSRGDYDWLTPAMLGLYRDFGGPEAEPLLTASRIDGVVLVQAAPTEAETRYLLREAQSHPYVRGVVGWADLTAPQQLALLVREPHLVAIRPMLQDLPDPRWILRPVLAPALRMLVETGLAFEALVKPEHLSVIATLLERHSKLRIMLDHAAKPLIRERTLQPWTRDLARLAECPNVYCKLSGLLSEAEPGAPPEVLAPYVETVLELFGAERVVWGSDWPVLTSCTDYASWLGTIEQLTAHLPASGRGSIFGGAAQAFYRLARVGP